MKRKFSLLLAFIILIFSLAFVPSVANTKSPTHQPLVANNLSATCFCKISKDNLIGVQHATGVIKDLTGEVNKTYAIQGNYQQGQCETACYKAANAYVRSLTVATAACAANVPDSTSIYVYSAVGTKTYIQVLLIGRLRISPQVTHTTCTCPPSWACNGCSPQVAGGITSDGKCKKWAGENTLTPYPPDGTPLGSWGFTWGNAFVAWGTSANGGAPTCVTTMTSPSSCGWY